MKHPVRPTKQRLVVASGANAAPCHPGVGRLTMLSVYQRPSSHANSKTLSNLMGLRYLSKKAISYVIVYPKTYAIQDRGGGGPCRCRGEVVWYHVDVIEGRSWSGRYQIWQDLEDIRFDRKGIIFWPLLFYWVGQLLIALLQTVLQCRRHTYSASFSLDCYRFRSIHCDL